MQGEADDATAPGRLKGHGHVQHLHPQRSAPAQVAPDGAGEGRADLWPAGVVLHGQDTRLVALGIGEHGAVGRDHRDAGLQTLPVGPGEGLERRGRRPGAGGRDEDVPEEPGLGREPPLELGDPVSLDGARHVEAHRPRPERGGDEEAEGESNGQVRGPGPAWRHRHPSPSKR